MQPYNVALVIHSKAERDPSGRGDGEPSPRRQVPPRRQPAAVHAGHTRCSLHVLSHTRFLKQNIHEEKEKKGMKNAIHLVISYLYMKQSLSKICDVCLPKFFPQILIVMWWITLVFLFENGQLV